MPPSKTSSTKRARHPAVAAGAPKDRTQYLSRAVTKSVEILELLQEPMALHEVARRIKLSKTSAFRLLCTLESSGYLNQTAAGQYSLAPEIHRVANSRFLVRLLRCAAPLMCDLGRALRETINLAALFENRIEVIAIEESPELLRMSNVVGHILPPNASSLGKVITSFQSDERREKLIRSYGLYRFTPETITDRSELQREFERTREQGFGADREESVADGYCFAVPIFGRSGDVPAGISVSLPKLRMRNAEQEQRLVEALKATAAQISAAL